MEIQLLETFDILQDDYWRKKVIGSIPSILGSGHHNANNYKDLEKRLDQYDCFTVVTYDGRMVAISGLYNGGIYPDNMARVADRSYYYYWRNNPASGFKTSTKYNANHMVPFQVEVAKQKGYDFVFVSVQNPKKRNAIKMLIKDWPYDFVMQDQLCNTCRLVNNTVTDEPTCWQNVAVYKLNDKEVEFNLPSISLGEFDERFRDIKGIR